MVTSSSSPLDLLHNKFVSTLVSSEQVVHAASPLLHGDAASQHAEIFSCWLAIDGLSHNWFAGGKTTNILVVAYYNMDLLYNKFMLYVVCCMFLCMFIVAPLTGNCIQLVVQTSHTWLVCWWTIIVVKLVRLWSLTATEVFSVKYILPFVRWVYVTYRFMTIEVIWKVHVIRRWYSVDLIKVSALKLIMVDAVLTRNSVAEIKYFLILKWDAHAEFRMFCHYFWLRTINA